MKTLTQTIILILVFNLTASANAQSRNTYYVADYPALSEFFSIISEIASEGSSLAFFGYSEKRRTIKKDNCKLAKSTDVTSYFDEILDTISYDLKDPDERLPKKLVKSAREDWIKLMSQGHFEICGDTTTGHMTIGHLTIFKSKYYFIEFEFGYED